MWFKNIYFFAFTRPFNVSAEELNKALSEHTFTPLGSTEVSHFGWVNALGKHGNSLTHVGNGSTLICARKEEKILPSSVVDACLSDRIIDFEDENGRGVTKKEKEQMKEDIVLELLPRAFNRITDTHAYISAVNNIIVINSSSRGKAEDLLALLRKSLGTLPVTSISPDQAVDDVMTEWLTLNIDDTDSFESDKFTLGEEAEFNALGEHSAFVKVKNQDLASDEVKAHLDADKYVTKVALEYDDIMSLILCDDLSVKRIKFFDGVLELREDTIDDDDVIAKLDADFILMSGELNRFIHDLLAEFQVTTHEILEQD